MGATPQQIWSRVVTKSHVLGNYMQMSRKTMKFAIRVTFSLDFEISLFKTYIQ